jgi:hypothetical protein
MYTGRREALQRARASNRTTLQSWPMHERVRIETKGTTSKENCLVCVVPSDMPGAQRPCCRATGASTCTVLSWHHHRLARACQRKGPRGGAPSELEARQ